MSYRPHLPRLAALLLAAALSGCGGGDVARVQAGALEIGISADGRLASLTDLATGRAYLPEDAHAPFLTLRKDGVHLEPASGVFSAADSTLVFDYEGGLQARVHVRPGETHATFELVSVSDAASVELAIWGPYPTTIDSIIGETVGVVRGPEFAIGLQALNPRTLGGYPWRENDRMPQIDVFELDDYSDLSEQGKRGVLYSVEAAMPDTLGSTLQAYTRNRHEDRVIPNWRHERYVAPAFDDGGIVGSKIALFGTPVGQALQAVGAIEVAEGLPHPMIDGEWGKTARSASAAYVILDFSESTLDQAVDVVLKAGLRYLYHSEPFESWGHFPLNEDFPSGVEGLRDAVSRAGERGVMVGVHTLSNFISTTDPYVTPLPDPRLARVGTSALAGPVSATESEIVIESPDFFGPSQNDNLHAAMVGEELIRFEALSETAPWTLLDVERGAFGTRASSHESGAAIGRLADHGYRVFLTDPELTVEMARTLADLFNRTGLRQISFDGLEGNRSTGLGNYGEVLFTSSWYDALSDDIRSHYIADASRTNHYFWHMYTRMNWGEPWYAGFRESQTEYRLKNQAYFQRNMMPGMLGWFRLQPETSVEDIEWMLARSAAFDAGYALSTRLEFLEANGRTDEILDLIGIWEAARMADAFTAEQKLRMEDIDNEFHLERSGDSSWRLFQVHSSTYRLEGRERQPGEPSHQTFPFQNPEAEQTLHFLLTAEGGAAGNLRMELDGVRQVDLPVHLAEGETLAYEGGDQATIYSSRWREVRSVPVDAEVLRIATGAHELVLDADLVADGGQLKVELRIWSEGEGVSGR